MPFGCSFCLSVYLSVSREGLKAKDLKSCTCFVAIHLHHNLVLQRRLSGQRGGRVSVRPPTHCSVWSGVSVRPPSHLLFAMPRVEPPPYGWCAGDHSKRQRVPAQSGYTDTDGHSYCKHCFKFKFPELYAMKMATRNQKKVCPLCGHEGELLKGVCRPCGKRRACGTCGDINHDPDAPVCSVCCERKDGAAPGLGRLALWCPKGECTTDADRQLGLCAACFQKHRARICDHCGNECATDSTQHKCVELSCSLPFYVCGHCSPLHLAGRRLHCKGCWYASGQACIICSKVARHHLRFFRCCKLCHNEWFCRSCNAAHEKSGPARCAACHTAPAMWCAKCCTPERIASGLCAPCLQKQEACCQHCFTPADASECKWCPCATD